MFTGIIEETGRVRQIRRSGASAEISIGCKTVLGTGGGEAAPRFPEPPTRIGDSIAVNGICLTVTHLDAEGFTADVMHETIRRSSFSVLKPGSKVNLERALLPLTRMGGHIVTGHIDGTGIIRKIEKDSNAVWYTIAAPNLIDGIVEKGSIAIDGISLTVADTDPAAGTFRVSIIPHTREVTSLSDRKTGDPVNLETDVIGKYTFAFLRSGGPENRGENIKTDGAADKKTADERIKTLLGL